MHGFVEDAKQFSMLSAPLLHTAAVRKEELAHSP